MGGHKIKKCSVCGLSKPHCAKNLCYSCYSMKDYEKHKEKRLEAMKNYRNNLENKKKVREYQNEYYSKPEQVEKARIRKQKYYLKNKEEINRKQKIARKTEHYNVLNRIRRQRRRAKLLKVTHDFTYDEWLLKLRESNGVCQICNEYVGEDNLTLDHIYPLSKAEEGTVYTINDVQPLCQSCNCSKGVHLMDELIKMKNNKIIIRGNEK